MKFTNLLVLYSTLSYAANAATVHRSETYSFTSDEWQAKWDAWPTNDGSQLRQRMLAARELKLAGGSNITDTSLISDINPSEICERLTGCVGTAAATAAEYAKVAAVASATFCSNLANAGANAMAANNYALAKQVALFTVTQLALPIVIGGVTVYYLNLRLQNDAPQSKDDSCGISQTPAIAEQAGTATYGFCLQLQTVTSDAAFSRVDFGTVSTDNTQDDVGLDMKMRLFISTVQGKYSATCELLGVWLRAM